MNYAILGQIQQPLEDTLDVGSCVTFLHSFFELDFRLEIALIAQLSDDVAVVVASEDFQTFQDVGVVDLLQDLDLGKQQFFQFL